MTYPIGQAYAEHDVKLTDWTGEARTPIHGEPTANKLCEAYQTAVGRFAQLDRPETYWYRYKADWGTEYEGQKVDFIDVMAEPDVTRRYWQVMREMMNQDMFDIKMDTSPHLSRFEGLKPHFPLTGVQTLPDVDDKFPITSDVAPITQGELESLHIMSNIVVKMNNTQLICSRLLDDWSRQQVWRVQEHREAFLTTTNLLKTATEIQKDAAIKCSVLSKLVRRRDAMLRQNVNPIYRGNQFISAYPTTRPFPTAEEMVSWGEMKEAMEKVADEKATSDKEWRENIRHFEEEWHTTEIASREALMDEVVKKRREIKERNIALERRQWTTEQREREALKEANLTQEEKQQLLQEQKEEEKREEIWKQQFLQKLMMTEKPHLKDFGDKTWQQAALEVGMDWAKLTEKEREEQARQQTAATKKKEALLAAKERALAAYKAASKPAAQQKPKTTPKIDPKTTQVPYPEQQKEIKSSFKDPAVIDETSERATVFDTMPGSRSALHRKLERKGEALNKQLEKPKGDH